MRHKKFEAFRSIGWGWVQAILNGTLKEMVLKKNDDPVVLFLEHYIGFNPLMSLFYFQDDWVIFYKTYVWQTQITGCFTM